MALISCNECGKEISDKAVQCLQCGNPIAKQPKKVVKSTRQEQPSDKTIAFQEMASHKTNHILHLLLSIVSAGFWVIIWLIISASNTSKRNKIRKLHRLKPESNPPLVIGGLFILIFIFLLIV